MALTNTSISNVPASIFTSVGSNAVTVLYICNSGSLPVHFNIYAVPNGGTPNSTNTIYFSIPLTINDTYVIDTEKLILENGDALYANIDLAPNVTVRVVSTVSTIGV